MALPVFPHLLSVMQDGAPASVIAPTSQGADCRFIDNDEDMDATVLNRPVYALGENTDYLYNKVAHFVTAAPTGGVGDYVGDAAVSDAIVDLAAAGGGTLFVKNGSYDMTSAGLDITSDAVHVLGESRAGVILQVADKEFVISGDQNIIENLTIDLNTAASDVRVTGNGNKLRRVSADEGLDIDSISGLVVEDCSFSSAGYALDISDALNLSFIRSTFSGTGAGGGLRLEGAASSDIITARFQECTLQCDDQIALDTGTLAGKLVFDHCTFEMTTGGNQAWVLDDIVAFSDAEALPIAMSHCRFSLKGWNGTANAIELKHTYASDLEVFVDSGLVRDNAVLYTTDSRIDTIAVDLNEVVHTGTAGSYSGVLEFTGTTIVNDLRLVGVAGEVGKPLVYLNGVSTDHTRAELNGAFFQTTSSFTPGVGTQFPALVETAGYCTARRVNAALPQTDYDNSNAIWALMGMFSAAADAVDVTIEDCVVEVDNAVDNRIYYGVAFDCDGSNVVIQNNRFTFSPDTTIGSSMPIYCDGYAGISAAADADGLVGGKISKNHIQFLGTCDASSNTPVRNAIFLDDNCYMWVIEGNTVEVDEINESENGAAWVIFVNDTSEDFPAAQPNHLPGNGSSAYGNIIRDKSTSNTFVPKVTCDSHDGTGTTTTNITGADDTVIVQWA